MKKEFQIPQLYVEKFEVEDVITATYAFLFLASDDTGWEH